VSTVRLHSRATERAPEDTHHCEVGMRVLPLLDLDSILLLSLVDGGPGCMPLWRACGLLCLKDSCTVSASSVHAMFTRKAWLNLFSLLQQLLEAGPTQGDVSCFLHSSIPQWC
jgi:hypothetical protein